MDCSGRSRLRICASATKVKSGEASFSCDAWLAAVGGMQDSSIAVFRLQQGFLLEEGATEGWKNQRLRSHSSAIVARSVSAGVVFAFVRVDPRAKCLG